MILLRLLLILLFLNSVLAVAAQEYDVISPENVSQLERVARLGRGVITDVWFENDTILMIQDYYTGDMWEYDTLNITNPPMYHPAVDIPETELVDDVSPVEVDNDKHIVRLINPETGDLQLQVQFLAGELITNYQLSDDGRYLAIMTTDNWVESIWDYSDMNISIWDTQTGTRLSIIPYFAPRSRMIFSHDGRYFAIFSQNHIFYNAGSTLHFVSLFDSQTGQLIAQLDNNFHRSASAMTFSPDDTLFAVVFYDGRIVLLDTATGEVQADIVGYGGYAIHIHFLDDSILVSKDDGYTDWWDATTFDFQRRQDDCLVVGVNVVDNSLFCRYVTSFQFEQQSTILDLDTYEHTTLDDERINDHFLTSAIYPPNQDYFITTTKATSQSPRIWDYETNDFVSHLDADHDICALEYLADRQHIASRNGGIIWDADSLEIIVQVPTDSGFGTYGAYSETGDWVAFPDYEQKGVVIWRLSDWYHHDSPKPIAIIPDFHSGHLVGSPDGRLLVIGEYDKTTLVETETFTVVHQFDEQGLGIQFSPDGRYLILADGICWQQGADESLQIGSADIWAVPQH